LPPEKAGLLDLAVAGFTPPPPYGPFADVAGDIWNPGRHRLWPGVLYEIRPAQVARKCGVGATEGRGPGARRRHRHTRAFATNGAVGWAPPSAPTATVGGHPDAGLRLGTPSTALSTPWGGPTGCSPNPPRAWQTLYRIGPPGSMKVLLPPPASLI